MTMYLYAMWLIMAVAVSWLYQQSTRVESGFYLNVLMRGGTKGSYLIGTSFSQFLLYILMGLLIWANIAAMLVALPMIIVPIIMWAVSETIFLNLLFDLFRRQGKCQEATLLSIMSIQYLMIGLLGNILSPMILNATTGTVAQYISICFGYFPSSNFLFSVTSIINRNFIALIAS